MMNLSVSLIKEYERIKARYPDSIILFQVGIFYRLVQDDAMKVASDIGLKLITMNIKEPVRKNLSDNCHCEADVTSAEAISDGIATPTARRVTQWAAGNDTKGSIALAGFPSSGLDKYIGRLVRRGHSVALCGKDNNSGSWLVNERIKVISNGKANECNAGNTQNRGPDSLDDTEDRKVSP